MSQSAGVTAAQLAAHFRLLAAHPTAESALYAWRSQQASREQHTSFWLQRRISCMLIYCSSDCLTCQLLIFSHLTEYQLLHLQGPASQLSMSASEARAPDRRMALQASPSCAPSRISVAAAFACVPQGSPLRRRSGYHDVSISACSWSCFTLAAAGSMLPD